MKVPVIVRANNDMPLIADTLQGLARQDIPLRIIAFDNDSKDGTREELERYADHIFDVPRGSYVPGRVLNQAMAASRGEVVAFLNSDCTPQHPGWLRELLAAFEDETVAAAFGRQIPRPDCRALMAKDTESTYGDGANQVKWRHCFSMASSAVRRSVWERMPFSEDLQYSEDIDWTWRARRQSWNILYVPTSVVMHSHNYSLSQFYKRHRGEGKAEAKIFSWTKWERSLIRYSGLPLIRQVGSDWKHCLKTGEFREAFCSPALRISQALGRRAGFCEGLQELEGKNK